MFGNFAKIGRAAGAIHNNNNNNNNNLLLITNYTILFTHTHILYDYLMSTDSQNNQRAKKSGGQFILKVIYSKYITPREQRRTTTKKRKKGQSLSNLAVKKFMNYKNVVI